MEAAAAEGALDEFDLVILDLDLRNAFPSLEWDAVRGEVAARAPKLLPWTAWCHGAPARVLLPSGYWMECDRGAEQGDPLGPACCGLVLLRCQDSAQEAVRKADGWAWDALYMDDSQVVTPSPHVDAYVAGFDEELLKCGGTRLAPDGTVESIARPLRAKPGGPPSGPVPPPAPAWATEYVRKICKLPPGFASAGKVLGVDIEGGSVSAQFCKAVGEVETLCEALQDVADPAAELAMLRMSANVAKVTHLLSGKASYSP